MWCVKLVLVTLMTEYLIRFDFEEINTESCTYYFCKGFERTFNKLIGLNRLKFFGLEVLATTTKTVFSKLQDI